VIFYEQLIVLILLIIFIKKICNNLPCPDCQSHASKFITSLDINQVTDKEKLKIYLLNFHNAVNTRLKKPLFSLDQLNMKYKNANTIAILNNFIKVWQHRNSNVRLLVNSFHKDLLMKDFISWIKNNQIHFYP